MTAKNIQGGMKQNDREVAIDLARFNAGSDGIYSSFKFRAS